MSRILLIARREWVELARQRALMFVTGTLFLLIAGLSVTAFALLSIIAADPDTAALMTDALAAFGVGDQSLEAFAAGWLRLVNFLVIGQFMGITGVLAGHTVLHDRQCHTLPFLLLAPVRRVDLLAGKVLGALGWPTLLYYLVFGPTYAAIALLPINAHHGALLPPSPGWIVAFVFGAPLWATFVASIGAVVSSLSHDVRTAQQAVWFALFFVILVAGYLVAGAIEQGALAGLVVAAVGAVCAAVALAIGAQVVSRDLGR